MIYKIEENGLCMEIEMTQGKPVYLLYMRNTPEKSKLSEKEKECCHIQEIQVTGAGTERHIGIGTAGTLPGHRMNYVSHTDEKNQFGRILKIHTKDEETGLTGTLIYQFWDGLSLIRCRNILKNEGKEDLGLELVSTFVQPGVIEKEEEIRLLLPHNTWTQEVQWKENSLEQLGCHVMGKNFHDRIQISSVGSWSSGTYLPMACMKNVTKGTIQFWQIEHNGAWNWELLGENEKMSLVITGPNERDHHWWKKLKPGETFETIPAAIGIVEGDIDKAFEVLTKYRRRIRRENRDNQELPIIFNDYMNCLWADPTTEKELPMIAAAAAVGCEYYCIDSGWYTDRNWWYDVGEWKPSKLRFPNGLKEVTDYIIKKGMIPGIWLEIEFMGVHCPMVQKVPPNWFFQRHGKPMIDRGRYHLDFRNPEVYAYARKVVDELILKYGIGYFKIDYNTNAFLGTELFADSFGDGLLEHNRAYLRWIDDIFRDYPEIVIENCSSGGMRMDYAMLSRMSIQSTSDQTDYLKYASIAVNAPTAVTPEQAAIWSYPLKDASVEQVIFNCVNSCLMRIHQSGNTEMLSEEKKTIIKEEFAFYKSIRKKIPQAIPFWPLGIAKDGDAWMSLGMKWEKTLLVAVWRINGSDTCEIPIRFWEGKNVIIKKAFPKEDEKCEIWWNEDTGILKVQFFEKPLARVFELKIEEENKNESFHRENTGLCESNENSGSIR